MLGLPLLAVLAALSDPQASDPFIRTHASNSASTCIYWSQRSYLYQPSVEGYSKLASTDVDATIDAAFATWQTLSSWCSGFEFKRGDPIPHAIAGYQGDGGTNNNVIVFREANCQEAVPPGDPCLLADSLFVCANKYNCWAHPPEAIALTTTTYNTRTGVILDADIELNAGPPPGGQPPYLFTTVSFPTCPPEAPASNCVATDLRNTLTHEIGHVIGLDHVADPESTMFKNADPGETLKRIIDQGTAAGFCDLYPRAAPSTSACTLTAPTGKETQSSAKACSVGGGLGGMTASLLAGVGLLRRRRVLK